MTSAERVILLARETVRDFAATKALDATTDFTSFARGYWKNALSHQPELNDSWRSGYLALAHQYRQEERR